MTAETTAHIDLYAIIDVCPEATTDQIKSAYRRRSKVCHPDMGGTHEEMVTLIMAWQILSDRDKRAAYDRERLAGAQDGVARHKRNHGQSTSQNSTQQNKSDRASAETSGQAARKRREQQWQQARATAEATARKVAGSWQEFQRWADAVATQSASFEKHRWGKVASGAIVGLLIGGVFGAFASRIAGLDMLAGAGVGVLTGIGGGVYGSWPHRLDQSGVNPERRR